MRMGQQGEVQSEFLYEGKSCDTCDNFTHREYKK